MGASANYLELFLWAQTAFSRDYIIQMHKYKDLLSARHCSKSLESHQRTNENLVCSTGNSTQRSVVTYMGRQSKKEGIYVYE